MSAVALSHLQPQAKHFILSGLVQLVLETPRQPKGDIGIQGKRAVRLLPSQQGLFGRMGQLDAGRTLRSFS